MSAKNSFTFTGFARAFGFMQKSNAFFYVMLSFVQKSNVQLNK